MKFYCLTCDREQDCDADYLFAGMRIKCPECHTRFTVAYDDIVEEENEATD